MGKAEGVKGMGETGARKCWRTSFKTWPLLIMGHQRRICLDSRSLASERVLVFKVLVLSRSLVRGRGEWDIVYLAHNLSLGWWKVLEIYGGDGCITIDMCLMPLNLHSKMVKMINATLCIFYHN